ncbi:MAG: hypothetical protein ABJL57_03910 [Hyphomonas sp.]|uniref:hypothetical protein n=1 Tax=Hyphomonas sp. TaxID=87 RepID=UPI003298C966
MAFENEEDREAARNFMDLLAASESDGKSWLQQGRGIFRPLPDTHPAFFANSPESGQLRTATRSFPAVLAASLPARTTRHEQVSLLPFRPPVQSSYALRPLDVRKPEMVSGLKN